MLGIVRRLSEKVKRNNRTGLTEDDDEIDERADAEQAAGEDTKHLMPIFPS